MDDAALDELRDERIGWHFKGFPATFAGMTAGEVIAARPALTEFATPLMYLDGAALEHNIRTMAQYCADSGVDLAPHGKTSMAPQLFRRQLDAGAWGITAATIAHVRVYRAFGVPTVLLGNQLVDPDALGWIAGELRRDPEFRFLCFADSLEGVAAMQSALTAHDAPRPIDVVVDVGADGGRTGVRSISYGVDVARAIRQADRLRLVGTGGFEGAIGKDRSDGDLAKVRDFLRMIRTLAMELDKLSLFDEADEIILTAGGSAYFDDVVEIFGEMPTARTVLRSGAYVTHDDGHYVKLTPLSSFQPALRIRGRVLSRPEEHLALLDFGKRDAPFDLGMPVPLDHPAEITALADQHAFLRSDDLRLSVGDIVTCGISHPCTAFDKWQLLPVVEDGHVVDLIRTFF